MMSLRAQKIVAQNLRHSLERVPDSENSEVRAELASVIRAIANDLAVSSEITNKERFLLWCGLDNFGMSRHYDTPNWRELNRPD